MQFKVYGGEHVSGTKKMRGSSMKPSPFNMLVVGVFRGTLIVHEENSANGLAKIVCHQASEDGTFWYEYTDRNTGNGVSEDITALWNSSRKNLVIQQLRGPFINTSQEVADPS